MANVNHSLFPQCAEVGGFFSPLVFLPLRRALGWTHAREPRLKPRKPQNPALDFVGVVAEEKPNQQWMRAGEHEDPRRFAFEQFVPAAGGRTLSMPMQHVEGKSRQPHAVKEPL